MAAQAVLQNPFASPAGLRRGILVRIAQLLLQILITGAVLFACAGSLSWWRGWLYVAVTIGSIAALAVYVYPRNAEIIAARSRLHRDTATFDKVLLRDRSATPG